MQWPDELGNPVALTLLTDAKLLADTQRLVDCVRMNLDHEVCRRISELETGTETNATIVEILHCQLSDHYSTQLQNLVDECVNRSLALDQTR